MYNVDNGNGVILSDFWSPSQTNKGDTKLAVYGKVNGTFTKIGSYDVPKNVHTGWSIVDIESNYDNGNIYIGIDPDSTVINTVYMLFVRVISYSGVDHNTMYLANGLVNQTQYKYLNEKKLNISDEHQANWNESNSSSKSYIKNKPTGIVTSTTSGLKIEVVAALPASPDANTLYLVTGS